MRIDEKEDQIKDICDRYGLTFDYAWGKYYISVKPGEGVLSLDFNSFITFSRGELEGWEVDRVEELVVAYVIVSGVW